MFTLYLTYLLKLSNWVAQQRNKKNLYRGEKKSNNLDVLKFSGQVIGIREKILGRGEK